MVHTYAWRTETQDNQHNAYRGECKRCTDFFNRHLGHTRGPAGTRSFAMCLDCHVAWSPWGDPRCVECANGYASDGFECRCMAEHGNYEDLVYEYDASLTKYDANGYQCRSYDYHSTGGRRPTHSDGVGRTFYNPVHKHNVKSDGSVSSKSGMYLYGSQAGRHYLVSVGANVGST